MNASKMLETKLMMTCCVLNKSCSPLSVVVYCLHCFDVVGWAAGRASSL